MLLLVDDEQAEIAELDPLGQQRDLEVVTAQTARQGLAAVAAEAPDVAIVDVRLPDLSGLELFDRLRKLDPRLPVVVVTAFATTETAIEAMKRGAFEYLLKPVDLHAVYRAVAEAVTPAQPPAA